MNEIYAITDGIDTVSNKIIYWADDGVVQWNELRKKQLPYVRDLVNVKKTQMNADSAIAKRYPEILKNCTSYDWAKDIKELPNSFERNTLHSKLNTLHSNIRAGIIRQLLVDLRFEKRFEKADDGLWGLEEITLAGKVFNIENLRTNLLSGWY